MNGLEKFEKFLQGKHKYLSEMIWVLDGSLDGANQEEFESLIVQRELLNDIIHHFELFVKGENDV